MKPFVVLWQLTAEMYNIVGDEDGKLGIATDALVYDPSADYLHSKTLKVVKTDLGGYYLVPIMQPLSVLAWEEDTPPISTSYEVERIPIETWMVDNRWRVRCGYGPKTKTWVIRSPRPIDVLELAG